MGGPRDVFLVECFAPALGDGPSSEAALASAACAEMRTAQIEVAYLGALIVPGDELAFHVFAAADAAVVLEASRRAHLRVERVVRSVAVWEALPIAVEPERSVAHTPGEIGA